MVTRGWQGSTLRQLQVPGHRQDLLTGSCAVQATDVKQGRHVLPPGDRGSDRCTGPHAHRSTPPEPRPRNAFVPFPPCPSSHPRVTQPFAEPPLTTNSNTLSSHQHWIVFTPVFTPSLAQPYPGFPSGYWHAYCTLWQSLGFPSPSPKWPVVGAQAEPQPSGLCAGTRRTLALSLCAS